MQGTNPGFNNTEVNDMATLNPISINPELLELFAERVQELHQDDAKSNFLNLGSGNNSLSSSSNSNLQINGQAGNDTIQLFGTGSDTIYTGSGTDFVFAGAGNDTVFGGSQNDKLIGYDGNDKLFGGSGDDILEGDFGADVLSGGSGNDKLFGGAGADVMTGGIGNDELFGDHDGSPTSLQGRDTLSGGFGNDKIHGGGNADVMFGNDGADQFIFDHVNDFVAGHPDFIGDFSHAEGDKIVLTPVDANSILPGNQNFVFTDGPSTQAGTVWLGDAVNGQQHVFMNINGGAADLEIVAKFDDANMTTLLQSDFQL